MDISQEGYKLAFQATITFQLTCNVYRFPTLSHYGVCHQDTSNSF